MRVLSIEGFWVGFVVVLVSSKFADLGCPF